MEGLDGAQVVLGARRLLQPRAACVSPAAGPSLGARWGGTPRHRVLQHALRAQHA